MAGLNGYLTAPNSTEKGQKKEPAKKAGPLKSMVGTKGFEPLTSTVSVD